MKTLILTLIVFQLALISCSKSSPETSLIAESATVSVTKFPCGPTCTADAWLLTTSSNQSYEAVNLPDAYKVSEMAVQVTFKKTGLRSDLLQGSAAEKVEVIAITKR